jgi:hypothetical protein
VGGILAVLVGFAFVWSAPFVGILFGGFFLVLMCWGVLPYFVRPQRLVLTAEVVELQHGGPWLGVSRRVRYADVRDVRGALEAGDTMIHLHDVAGREYAIVADLLPSQTDFELVVCTLGEQLAKAREEHITPSAETSSDVPPV